MMYYPPSRRAQLMYSGTESTTTKEGATVFEVCTILSCMPMCPKNEMYNQLYMYMQHDPALSKEDDRLKMGSAGRGPTRQTIGTPSGPALPPTTEQPSEETMNDTVSDKKSKK